MTRIIDGKAIVAVLKGQILHQVEEFIKENEFAPRLAVLLVGNNPASEIYVAKKIECCHEVGIGSEVIRLPNTTTESEILEILESLSENKNIDGILVQLPLPPHIDNYKVFNAINPLKDVDVFNAENVGLLVQGRPRFLPCTPHGIQKMLTYSGLAIAGKHVVVINRSDIVGKPLSSMLIQDNDEYANATVTVCHDKTSPEQLKLACSLADIIVVAVGIPDFLTDDMVHENQIVIDVGTTRVEGKIKGDVHADVKKKVAWATRATGGVGPMTVACLMENTLKAATLREGYVQTRRQT